MVFELFLQIGDSMIYERIKVRAACYSAGINDRTAKLCVHIHRLTKKGTLGREFFELHENETLEQKMGYLAIIRGNASIGQQVNDVKRMFTDTQYRNDSYKVYTKFIKPRVQNYSLKEVIKQICG